MDVSTHLDMCRQALWCALLVAGPLLLAAIGGGTLASLLQSALRVNDPTPLLIVRIIATAVTLVVLMPWLLDRLSQFAAVAWGTPTLLVGH